MSQYDTIDADGHVQEPGDALAEFLPAEMKPFAPRHLPVLPPPPFAP